jgi:hypothetical protein
MAVKFSAIFHLYLPDTQKFTQIRIFGLKIHHLATLIHISAQNRKRKQGEIFV